MTPAQLTAFKAAIQAEPNVAAFLAAGDMFSVAAYYNAASAPATSVWRPNIPLRELNTAIDWAVFAALTVGKQNAYFAMTQGGSIDATSANIRSGFNAVFGAGATLTALTALAQRTGTRFETLAAFLANGVSSVFGLTVTPNDVSEAMARG